MCTQCNKYREALEKIASPFVFPDALDPQTDAIIAYVSMKVGIAMEALQDGIRNKEKI
jgi:hypothetical protein